MNRNLPGKRSEDWNSECFNPKHLQELIQYFTSLDIILNHLNPPIGVDSSVWQLEFMRQIVIELNDVYVLLLDECTFLSCPEMKMGDWVYLCAAHSEPRSCTAMGNRNLQ